MDVEFSVIGRRASVEKIVGWLDETRQVIPSYFVCVPSHSVEVARRDREYAVAIQMADLVAPDGAGIVLASRINGGRIRERVCGPDLLSDVCNVLNEHRPGTRMFFLGGTPGRLEELCRKVRREYPALVVAGTLAPPYRHEFTERESADMVEAINRSSSDILWVGLGAPKQEKWTLRHRASIHVRVIGPVGAAFDFYTGHVKLGPRWVQACGLIWLHRLLQQPRRLWRRNLDSPIFLTRVVLRRMRSIRSHSRRPA